MRPIDAEVNQMREILFRGKRLDSGEWVNGNLFLSDTDGRAYILAGS